MVPMVPCDSIDALSAAVAGIVAPHEGGIEGSRWGEFEDRVAD
jgi:hypothetical protein